MHSKNIVRSQLQNNLSIYSPAVRQTVSHGSKALVKLGFGINETDIEFEKQQDEANDIIRNIHNMNPVYVTLKCHEKNHLPWEQIKTQLKKYDIGERITT